MRYGQGGFAPLGCAHPAYWNQKDVTIFDIISPRAFTSLWFWIGVALVWGHASAQVLGVPWDIIRRAKSGEADSVRDMNDAVRIALGRIARTADKGGIWLAGLIGFAGAALISLGWFYRVEFFRALTCLALPLLALALLDLRWALRIFHGELVGEPLRRTLVRLRWARRAVGALLAFVTLIIGAIDIIRSYILF